MTFVKKIDIVSFPIIILGFSSLVIQVIFLREFMSVFYGSELVIGIILALWMTLTGIGAYIGKLGKKNCNLYLLILQFMLGALPPVIIFLIRYFRNIAFPYGRMLNITEITLYTSAALFPYCIISGALFTLYSISLSSVDNKIGKVYYLDCFGGFAGGIIGYFALFKYISVFNVSLIIFLLNLIASIILFNNLSNNSNIIINNYLNRIKYNVYSIIIILISIFAVIAAWKKNIDFISKGYEYRNQKMILNNDTQYGNLVITKTAEQLNIYENGALSYSSDNPQFAEETVHYGLIQRPKANSILIISGGLSGIIDEVIKYKPAVIDYIEINPGIIKLLRNNPKIMKINNLKIINEDGRRYIIRTCRKYDAVLICLTEPASAQLNRNYSIEYFKLLKKRLNSSGMVMFSLQPTGNYAGSEALKLNSVMYSTVSKVFRNIKIIPAGRNYYIASDSLLIDNFIVLFDIYGINNKYVNKYFVDEFSLRFREDRLLGSIDKSSMINTDFEPAALENQIKCFLSIFGTDYWVIAIIAGVPLLFYFLRLRSNQLGMFAVGFSNAGILVMILLSLQVLIGNVYGIISLLIALFMGGMAIGAYSAKYLYKYEVKKTFFYLQLMIAALILLLPILINFLKIIDYNELLINSSFLTLAFIFSSLCGAAFNISAETKIKSIKNTAAGIFGADMAGAAAGALFVGSYIFPLFGITFTCILLASLNLLILFVIKIFSHRISKKI